MRWKEGKNKIKNFNPPSFRNAREREEEEEIFIKSRKIDLTAAIKVGRDI
jgi:hypothetical protein